MKVKYDINRKDYWNFNKYTFIHIPILRYLLIFCLIVLLFPISRSISYYIGENIGKLIIYLTIMSLCFLLGFNIFKLIIMRLPNSKHGMLGEHTIEIVSEGIIEKTQVNEGFHSWKGVKSIHFDKRYIYIFIDNTVAHIIPKRCFSSKDEAEEFYNTAIELWKQNTSI